MADILLLLSLSDLPRPEDLPASRPAALLLDSEETCLPADFLPLAVLHGSNAGSFSVDRTA